MAHLRAFIGERVTYLNLPRSVSFSENDKPFLSSSQQIDWNVSTDSNYTLTVKLTNGRAKLGLDWLQEASRFI